jgi:hypothetical protein
MPEPRRIRGVAIIASLGVAILMGGGIRTGAAASLSVASAALTSYRTCALSATPTSTAVVADAEVRQADASTNHGSTTSLSVISNSGANQRIYVSFDLGRCSPLIPASANVRLASLRLFVTGLANNCRTLDFFRVAGSWAESTVTWANQPFGTTTNNPASGSSSATIEIGSPGSCQNRSANGYVAATVTADVSGFVDGSFANRGWMIRDDSEDSGSARITTFSAKELGTLAQVTQLIVTYVVVP